MILAAQIMEGVSNWFTVPVMIVCWFAGLCLLGLMHDTFTGRH